MVWGGSSGKRWFYERGNGCCEERWFCEGGDGCCEEDHTELIEQS